MARPTTTSQSAIIAILEEIHTAFAKVSRGDGVSLHEAEGLDSGLAGERLAKERRRDTDTHWTEIPAETISNSHSALCFMDAAGFRYYIPAYMIWTLQHYETSTSISSDATIYALWPNTTRAADSYALLTDAQRTCIARFLWFMATEAKQDRADAYAATRALEDYWYAYLPSDK